MSLEARDFAHGASFIKGSRDLGVGTLEAVYELVDNAIDADAENIHVHVEENDEYIRIYVEDDGRGIEKKVEADNGTEYDGITFALAFGDSYDQAGLQIGKFGWGLPSSATCTSLRTEIYSQKKDEEEWRYTYVDLDEMDESNNTRPPISESKSPDHLNLINNNPDSGTVVSLEKCDDTEPKTVSGIVSRLIKELPQVYRYFLEGDKNITVNGTELKPKDPLFMMEEAHNVGDLPEKVPRVEEPYLQKTIEIEDEEGNEVHPVKITVVWLDVEKIRSCDEWSGSWMSDHGLTETNQGFSLVRNGREIRDSMTMGMFKTHADKNYMRAEIEFPPELDDRFGIQTNKSRLRVKQSVKDKIEDELDNAPNQIHTKTRKLIDKLRAEKNKEEEEAEPSPSERGAKKAAKFLSPAKKQTEEEREEVEEEIEEKKEEEIEEIEEDDDLGEEEKQEKIQKTEKKYERRKNPNSHNVTTDTLGSGHFYEPEFRGNQVNAIINDSHRFYETYNAIRSGAYRVGDPVSADGGMEGVVGEQTEASILIDHILLSAARAELMMKDRYDGEDEDIAMEYIYQFRSEWSEALRAFVRYMEDGKEEAVTRLENR